jgi:hypothetical protein
MAALQQALGDPEVLLGAVTTPEQLALQPRLDALVSVVVGYTDWVVDAVSVRVVGGSALRIAEAVRDGASRRPAPTRSSSSCWASASATPRSRGQGLRAGDRRPRR